jgi:hypothetical protein
VAISAYGGAAGLITGWLRPSSSMTARLPLHSPVFAGIALACVVAVPAKVVAVLAWRRHPRDRDAAAVAGVLLVGWIVVELAVVRQFSALQVVYGLAGLGLIVSGRRRMLAEAADVVTALPLLLTAPLPPVAPALGATRPKPRGPCQATTWCRSHIHRTARSR